MITGEPNPVLTFQTIHDKDPTKREHASIFDGMLTNAAIQARLTAASSDGCGIFFTLNKCKGGRKRENVTGYRVLGVDFDGTPLPTAPPIPFDIITETSPGRFHGYYFLQPGDDLALWSDTMAQVAAYYDADPNCCDPPRVFRLPGSFHQKATPHRVRMIHKATRDAAQFDRHPIEDIRNAHPCEYKKPGTKSELRSADSPGNFYDNEADIEIVRKIMAEAKPAPGDRNNTAYRLAATANDYGITPDRALELLHEWNDANEIGLPDDELAHVVRSASAYKELPAGIKATVDAAEDFAGVPIDPQWLPTPEELAATIEKHKAQLLRHAGRTLDELIALPSPTWLVKDLMIEGGLTCIYGKPKAGKSLWAAELACSIATGEPFLDAKTVQGPIAYIMAEGAAKMFGFRLEAWAKERCTKDGKFDAVAYAKLRAKLAANIVVITNAVYMDDPEDVALFLKRNPGPYAAVFVDTLFRCMKGNPLDATDFSKFVAGCDNVRRLCRASVAFCHHEKRNNANGAFGSIVNEASVDLAVQVAAKPNGRTLFSVQLMRDGEPPKPWNGKIEPRTIAGATTGEVDSVGVLVLGGRGVDIADDILQAINDTNPGTVGQLVKTLKGPSKPTVERHLRKLREDGYLVGLRLTAKAMGFEPLDDET